MATRSQNTMSEGLQKMLSDIAQMKALPDANLEFLVNLETNLLGFLKNKATGLAGNAPQGGGLQGGGGVPGAAPGAAPQMPLFTAPGVGTPAGLRREPAMPSPDELRRVIQASEGG